MEKKPEVKVIDTNKYFSTIDIDGMFGIQPDDLCVVIMPYEKDKRGLPKMLGVLKEYNPMREGDYSITLVTGRAEGEDPDSLSTAMRELKEESGYDVQDAERWSYLGNMTTSKLVMQELPCFAVDITGLTKEEKEGDGTESEAKSKFMLMSVKEALNTNDSFIPTLFLKIFRYIFGFDLGKDEEVQPLDKVNNLKKKIDITYLNIDGVNGSLIRHDLQGEPYIEYTVKEITNDIKEIPSIIDGINIVIKIAESNL
jgi:8-oxo-dGTP pyrophosphatase MutT (NUDIX family)